MNQSIRHAMHNDDILSAALSVMLDRGHEDAKDILTEAEFDEPPVDADVFCKDSMLQL